MNRIINFRSWNPKLQRMSYGKDVDRAGFQFSEKLDSFAVLNSVKGEDVDEALMQFTGLVDKNNVEIFEGDVISIDGFESSPNILVFWSDEWCAFRGEYIGANKSDCSINDTCQSYAIVIGNEFQNPELLEK